MCWHLRRNRPHKKESVDADSCNSCMGFCWAQKICIVVVNYFDLNKCSKYFFHNCKWTWFSGKCKSNSTLLWHWHLKTILGDPKRTGLNTSVDSWQENASPRVSIRFHFPALYTNCYINISTVSYSFSCKKTPKTGVAASEMLGLCSVLEEEDDCSLIFLGRGFTPTHFFFKMSFITFLTSFFVYCWIAEGSFCVELWNLHFWWLLLELA